MAHELNEYALSLRGFTHVELMAGRRAVPFGGSWGRTHGPLSYYAPTSRLRLGPDGLPGSLSTLSPGRYRCDSWMGARATSEGTPGAGPYSTAGALRNIRPEPREQLDLGGTLRVSTSAGPRYAKFTVANGALLAAEVPHRRAAGRNGGSRRCFTPPDNSRPVGGSGRRKHLRRKGETSARAVPARKMERDCAQGRHRGHRHQRPRSTSQGGRA